VDTGVFGGVFCKPGIDARIACGSEGGGEKENEGDGGCGFHGELLIWEFIANAAVPEIVYETRVGTIWEQRGKLPRATLFAEFGRNRSEKPTIPVASKAFGL
jgi:hypothetical protein